MKKKETRLVGQEGGPSLILIICAHVEHHSGAPLPPGYCGAVNGFVEGHSPPTHTLSPLATPLPWLAADLMGLAAVEEKQ